MKQDTDSPEVVQIEKDQRPRQRIRIHRHRYWNPEDYTG